MAIDNEKPTGFMGSLWNNVSGFFDVGFNKVWTGLEPNVITAFKGIRDFFIIDWKKTEEDNWDKMLSAFERDKWIDATTKKELMKLRELPKGADVASYFAVFLLLTLKQVGTWSGVVGADITRNLNAQYRPVNASAGELIPAAFLDPKQEPEIKKMLAQLGLPEKQIELLFLSFHRAYDEGTIRSLFFRGIITETQVYERMMSIGFNDQRTKEIIQSWPVIPTLGDIVRYIAKEAFEPEMIELFGLLEDYPVEAEKWAKMQGLDKRWVEAEWVAHWKDLGVDFMLEAYHRNIVQWPLVERYMALIEIPPKLREIVRDTAFRVYTRVDVRRMHDLGVLDDDELVSAYLDQGYDENKAANMAQFTIRYNAQHQKDLTKSEILTGFKEDIINRSDAKDMLLELGYSENEAEYYVVYEEHKKNKDIEKLQLNNIKDRFQNNLIEETVCRDKLAKLGIASNRVNALVEQWLIDKFEDRKIPSKTDLDKFYKVGLIDIKRFYDELRILGYNDDYSKLYVNLAEQTKKGK